MFLIMTYSMRHVMSILVWPVDKGNYGVYFIFSLSSLSSTSKLSLAKHCMTAFIIN